VELLLLYLLLHLSKIQINKIIAKIAKPITIKTYLFG